MAIGKPVAFDASAEERLTRGFISMTTWRPVAGSTANCTLDPPVSTPTRRSTAKAALRHLLVLRVAESLCGSDGDGVTGVHPHRVQVLDGADHHAVVGPVPHHLELELLPAHDRLLDQDLGDGAGFQAGRSHALELLSGGSDARAAAAENVRGAHDHGQAHGPDRLAGLLHIVCRSGAGYVQADPEHGLP